MDATETTPSIEPGVTYRWEGGPTVEIIAVHERPEAEFAGHRIPAYATVKWSDERWATMTNLATLRASLRQGILTVEAVQA